MAEAVARPAWARTRPEATTPEPEIVLRLPEPSPKLPEMALTPPLQPKVSTPVPARRTQAVPSLPSTDTSPPRTVVAPVTPSPAPTAKLPETF